MINRPKIFGLPPVLIVGETGTGKSASVGKTLAENEIDVIHLGLPPEKTIILNAEGQALPIRDFDKTLNMYVTNHTEALAVIDAIVAITNDTPEKVAKKADKIIKDGVTVQQIADAEFVVIESLTALAEFGNMHYQETIGGWSGYQEFNKFLFYLLAKFKKIQKQTFILGIPEINPKSPSQKAFFKIHGQERKYGAIEKEFVVVLWTSPKFGDDGMATDIRMEYRMNRNNTAKAPQGMFKGRPPNDLFVIAQNIRRVYNWPLLVDTRRPQDDQLGTGGSQPLTEE